jgi:hypothetical protein
MECLVVFGKFFGALAIGKPVLYAGPEDSSVACLIRQHNLGFCLDATSLKDVAMTINGLSMNYGAMEALRKTLTHFITSVLPRIS